MAPSTAFLRAGWVAQGYRSLAEGEKVEFDLEQDNTGRKKAINVTGPGGANVQGAPRPPQEGYGGGGGGYSQVSLLTSPASSLNRIARAQCWMNTLLEFSLGWRPKEKLLECRAEVATATTALAAATAVAAAATTRCEGLAVEAADYCSDLGTATRTQTSMLVLQRAGPQKRCFCSSLTLHCYRHSCSFCHRVAMVAAATVATVAATAVAVVAVAEAPTATEAPPAPAKSMH